MAESPSVPGKRTSSTTASGGAAGRRAATLARRRTRPGRHAPSRQGTRGTPSRCSPRHQQPECGSCVSLRHAVPLAAKRDETASAPSLRPGKPSAMFGRDLLSDREPQSDAFGLGRDKSLQEVSATAGGGPGPSSLISIATSPLPFDIPTRPVRPVPPLRWRSWPG